MTASLNNLGTYLQDTLGILSLELALLAALVYAVCHFIPLTPALRHLLWLGILCKPVVALAVSSPWTIFAPLALALESVWPAADALPAAVTRQTGSDTPLPLTPETVSLAYEGWLALLWLVGVGTLSCHLLVGYSAVARLRRKASIQHGGPLFDALSKMRRASPSLVPFSHIATHDAVSSPMVIGILRPLIIVPTQLSGRLQTLELEAVLLHELAHIRRGDNLSLLLQRLVSIALFFHPTVWLAGHQLKHNAELACDDYSLQTTGDSPAYARGLVRVAELAHLKYNAHRRLPLMSIYAAVESNLTARTRRALAGGARRMGSSARLAAALLLCAAAAATLPSAGSAQTHESSSTPEIDWETIKSTDPAEWTDELKGQIEAAGHNVEAIAERVRAHLAQESPSREEADRTKRIWNAAFNTPSAEWSERLQAALLEINPGLTLEEIAARIRHRQREERVWKAAMATDPAEWSDELKAAILELRPDNTIEEIAAGIRQRQEHQRREKSETDEIEALKKGVIERAMYEPPEQWSDELKAAVVHLGWDLEEFTEGIRRRQEHRAANEESRSADKGEPGLEDFGRRIRAAVEAGDLTPEEGREKLAAARLRDFQRGVIQRAMHESPEKWSDRLREAIVRAGWDLAEFTEGIRQRQAAAAAGSDVNAVELNSLFQLETAIEGTTWGQVKEESRPEK